MNNTYKVYQSFKVISVIVFVFVVTVAILWY